MLKDDKLRMNVTVTRDFAKQIDEYADRFGHTRSEMAERLLVAGMDSIKAYDKYIMKPETAATIAVTLDSICSIFGLPRIFETTEEDREFLQGLKRRNVSRVKRYVEKQT